MRARLSAFTVLELMIVVMCVAILALLTVPAAQHESTRVRHAAALLVADLDYAQLNSIGHGDDPCVVVFNAAEHTYHLARQSDPATPIIDPATAQPYRTKFGENRAAGLDDVHFATLTLDANDQLPFTAIGALAHGSDAAITLQCGSSTITINIDATTGAATTE